jgi:hypothetical protein
MCSVGAVRSMSSSRRLDTTTKNKTPREKSRGVFIYNLPFVPGNVPPFLGGNNVVFAAENARKYKAEINFPKIWF